MLKRLNRLRGLPLQRHNMPELPEVETMCRGISAIVGRKIKQISRPVCLYRPITVRPEIDELDRCAKQQQVTAITRLGKRVLIHFGEYVLILQPKMSGLVLLDQPPDYEHCRLQVDFVGMPRTRLLFWDRRGLGTVELMLQAEVQSRIIDGRLGPDALAVTFDDFCAQLGRTQRPIKVALLDQKLVAGIGNLYASEMLHVAKIHPAKPSSAISRRKLQLLYDAMRAILSMAIIHEGSTLSDGTYRNALNDPGSYQNQHLVYDRADHPCQSCSDGMVQRIIQSQRSTFYCPRCQRM